MEEKPHWWRKLWHRIESIHTAYWLWEIALAALAAWKSRQLIPHTIGPTDYWLPIAVFIGTLAILTTLIQIATWSWIKFRRWRYPPSLRVVAQGGKSAAIEIHHSGEPTVWEARTRILKLPKKSPNPDPLLRQCYLRKDGKAARSLLLRDGESASITLGIIRWSHPLSSRPETWMAAVHADNNEHGTRVSSPYVTEVTLDTLPRQKSAQ